MVGGVLGEIRLFAGAYEPRGWAFCDGRSLAVGRNVDLYTLIANQYGGDTQNFALPNLPTIDAGNGLTARYIISLQGEFPATMSGFVGAIRLLPEGPLVPRGWSNCTGELLTSPEPLQQLIFGQRFGGDGGSSLALPLIPNLPATQGSVRYIVCVQGMYAPPPDSSQKDVASELLLGEVLPFAGDYIPGDLREALGGSVELANFLALASVEYLTIPTDRPELPLPNLPPVAAYDPASPNQVLRTLNQLVAVKGLYPARG